MNDTIGNNALKLENNMIRIKRPKKKNQTVQEKYDECFEEWVAYWRANPHRYITDYWGLTLYDFQKVLIYDMNMSTNTIFVASRGLAKSTLTLLFCLQRASLYPNQKILVVCPVKSQSKQFIEKVKDLMKDSPNLRDEIDIPNIKTGVNENCIPFKNGSKIFSAPYSENALGEKNNIIKNYAIKSY